MLGELDRPQEALTAYQQLIDDYRDDPSLREQVASALYNLGVTLAQLDRPQDELTAYQQLIDDYGVTLVSACAPSMSTSPTTAAFEARYSGPSTWARCRS